VFHNGEPFNADAVRFTFERVQQVDIYATRERLTTLK
jgi:ABC-type transport system substrate-binding protein